MIVRPIAICVGSIDLRSPSKRDCSLCWQQRPTTECLSRSVGCAECGAQGRGKAEAAALELPAQAICGLKGAGSQGDMGLSYQYSIISDLLGSAKVKDISEQLCSASGVQRPHDIPKG